MQYNELDLHVNVMNSRSELVNLPSSRISIRLQQQLIGRQSLALCNSMMISQLPMLRSVRTYLQRSIENPCASTSRIVLRGWADGHRRC